jgi:anti-sigma regulatory factor (Ser/Thr protein kinase)
MSTHFAAARFTVEASEAAPSEARALIREHLGDHQRTDDVLLAASELVSNAVRHSGLESGQEVRIDVHHVDEKTRVTITYPGRPFARSEQKRSPKQAGFGLAIVDAIAWRWDVEHDGEFTTSWFEI